MLRRHALLLAFALAAWRGGAAAQGIDLAQLEAHRRDGALQVEFAVRITLPKTVEDALQRGVPVYFEAVAELKKVRWYWRDERVARVVRSWRVAYQPLTGTWRVGLGGLNQSHPTLAEALASVSRSSGWRLADALLLDADGRYLVDFSYRLDTSQLPGPMQIGIGPQSDWALGLERVLRLEPPQP